ncbi:c-di-AMP phosphodiesterase, consists of a GGDEF-like and DHH domains [Anaerosphaera aminiphila DSM 21120]|uniref:Cyclic-di-AMP phosphodiesterase n=1 Tax=Anaerosphaera aminiphila DSM 21120 TaxID=1120995 RepID=A0A1M5USG2_9FIRM|nr:DHH family phosphoesterase [Anaerosphaera aminiphila]SHH65864.1 c-di-AMP phosphodiesterase, consists of a GGDEF-like and DHH domains [Anaerosphaera aminiphila DSM 21120]
MNKEYDLRDLKLYFIFSTVIVLFLIYFSPIIGIISLFVNAYFIYLSAKDIQQRKIDSVKEIENINADFESITKNAIFNMPFPLVITDENGKIVWYNSLFLNIFSTEEIMDENLSLLIPTIDTNSILDKMENGELDIVINKTHYKTYFNVVDVSKTQSDRNKMSMFYFVDNSEYEEIYEKYVGEFPIVVKIEVDNFDEAMDSTPSNNKPQLRAEIDSIINNYFKDYNALVRKYYDEMYLVIISYESLKQIKDKRFDLLDDLRELDKGNTIPITLSIGVSSFGLNLRDSYIESDTCLDLALGRGGDQAVVKVKDNYEFFGGKSKAVEKRNKVKARVLGVALKQLIDGANDVFIMGHKNADMDSIGSAIGVLRAVLNRNKKGYIVLNKPNPSINNIINRMKEEEEELYKLIISEETALSEITPKSLLIMVDNNKPSLTEAPGLIEKTPQVVIIDHHRRGAEFVENPVLTYIEPYASSTSELVTEMLTYMNDDLNLTHFEADALMSGIVVDTKNFTSQTGVRTFEAASTLRRAGADMQKVKQLFQDDLDTLLSKAEVIHNMRVVFDNIAISRLDKNAENSVLISAQSADELLDINEIKASFVLALSGDKIHISGRSRGDISVQLILEKIGGGGHLNMAAAQLDTLDLDEAEEMLLKAIKEYLDEGEVK